MQLPKGMSLIYQNFSKYIDENPYTDKSNFINGLSILDALFYIGPLQINELFSNYDRSHFNLRALNLLFHINSTVLKYTNHIMDFSV